MVHISRRLKIFPFPSLFRLFKFHSQWLAKSKSLTSFYWLQTHGPPNNQNNHDHIIHFFLYVECKQRKRKNEKRRYDFWRIIESFYEADLSLFYDDDKSTYEWWRDEGVISGSIWNMDCHFNSYILLCTSLLFLLAGTGQYGHRQDDVLHFFSEENRATGGVAVICIVPVGMLGTRNEWIFIYFYY